MATLMWSSKSFSRPIDNKYVITDQEQFWIHAHALNVAIFISQSFFFGVFNISTELVISLLSLRWLGAGDQRC